MEFFFKTINEMIIMNENHRTCVDCNQNKINCLEFADNEAYLMCYEIKQYFMIMT